MTTAAISTRSPSTRVTISILRCSTTGASYSAAGTMPARSARSIYTPRGPLGIQPGRQPGRARQTKPRAVRPDGSGLELLYGAQSHMTGTDGSEVHFLDPRPLANGEVLVRAPPVSAEAIRGD